VQLVVAEGDRPAAAGAAGAVGVGAEVDVEVGEVGAELLLQPEAGAVGRLHHLLDGLRGVLVAGAVLDVRVGVGAAAAGPVLDLEAEALQPRQRGGLVAVEVAAVGVGEDDDAVGPVPGRGHRRGGGG
ncbi:MAG: hypothetical protein ACK559_16980, partial [bacterium]